MVTVLSSWKEIAQFMGKGVRTVQRWEKQLGLPIHRPEQSKAYVVLADPDELLHWMRAHETAPQVNSDGYHERLRRMHQLTLQLQEQTKLVHQGAARLQQNAELVRQQMQKAPPRGRQSQSYPQFSDEHRERKEPQSSICDPSLLKDTSA